MELPNATTVGQAPALAASQTAPPPVQPDGRATADAKAISTDPTPDVPFPIPASPLQTGLVSKAALAEDDVAPMFDDTGVSAVQRTLKPYGISMLPEKFDAPKQEAAPETSSE